LFKKLKRENQKMKKMEMIKIKIKIRQGKEQKTKVNQNLMEKVPIDKAIKAKSLQATKCQSTHHLTKKKETLKLVKFKRFNSQTKKIRSQKLKNLNLKIKNRKINSKIKKRINFLMIAISKSYLQSNLEEGIWKFWKENFNMEVDYRNFT
jgi:hypothetical protein